MEDSIPVYDPKHLTNKIAMYLDLINKKRIVETLPATDAFVCRKASPSFQPPSKEDYQWETFNAEQSFQFGETKGDWFAFKGFISAPNSFNPQTQVLRFNFEISRNYKVRTWDDNSPAGPEGRFWINSQLIAATDEFHNGADILPEHLQFNDNSLQKGSVLAEARVFTGRCLASHVLSRFSVSSIDKNTEELYQKLRFYLSLAKEPNSDSHDRYLLLKALDSCIRCLDVRDCNRVIPLLPNRYHDPSNIAFYSSVPLALIALQKGLSVFPKYSETSNSLITSNIPIVNVIGYSHLDTCWLWPYFYTHFKFANTSSTMLHLQESTFPENHWKFIGTAAQVYKWLKKDDPKLYERILNQAKKGLWEVNGALWLEPDTTILSGESLCRQTIMGIDFMENQMGFKQTVCMVPDCFGFSAALPQILKSAGIESFITSKLSWSEYTQFPYDTFRWRGIDGSEILAHFITTPSSWNYQTTTYTGVSTAYELIGAWKYYKQKDILPQAALHTSGNGDGGGGITEEMCWNLHLMENLPKIEGVPRLRFPSLTELFEVIKVKKDQLPLFDDELYLEYHRGTLTSQEEVKRQNRTLESSLHNIEYLLSIAIIL